VEYLRADVQIVKDLPIELQSLDLEATGSLVMPNCHFWSPPVNYTYLDFLLAFGTFCARKHLWVLGEKIGLDESLYVLQYTVTCLCNAYQKILSLLLDHCFPMDCCGSVADMTM
jgi:hypothetical protein